MRRRLVAAAEVSLGVTPEVVTDTLIAPEMDPATDMETATAMVIAPDT
jgi:hypothetical protein